MNCPRCGTDTLDDFGPMEGVDIDFCSGCKGIWFDSGELAFYVEAPADLPNMSQAVSAGAGKGRKCPRCVTVEMLETRYHPDHDLNIDICPACKGIFLDRGELPKVEALAAATGGMEKVLSAAKALEKKGFLILGAGENK